MFLAVVSIFAGSSRPTNYSPSCSSIQPRKNTKNALNGKKLPNNLLNSYHVMKHLLTLVTALVLGCTCAIAATFTVTNTNDSGAGSLRQAITDANNALGPHVINFNIPGTGPFTISPATEFPALGGQQIEINGLSQPSATCGAPLIVINGASAPMSSSGLILNRAGHVVKGLVINGFSGIGIGVSGTGGHTLSCNFIGTNAAGTAAVANANGISVQPGSIDNRIGLAGEGNVIAGNRGYGIRLEQTSGNVLLSNIIGLNATGTAAVGNISIGVDIFNSTNTTIGTGINGRGRRRYGC